RVARPTSCPLHVALPILGTELHQDRANPMRYLTIDYWRSRQDRDAFKSTFAQEFQRLDALCESFTVQEKFLGDFDCFTNRLPAEIGRASCRERVTLAYVW